MPDNGTDQPITRKDLDLALSGLETRILQGVAHTVEQALASAEQRILDRTHEFVRDAQTELLRGFESFSAG